MIQVCNTRACSAGLITEFMTEEVERDRWTESDIIKKKCVWIFIF